ncbi:MAG: hypothetical protein CSB48_13550 [Proteobacteria bacterium]|nr:MAG: hypothetical protein CSB48_13550 [Pseudomonadota bacterium]PIE40493.1 MAG: hypothetical protein CSA51_00345 [Gammaproteobacteria bacterium]
MKERRRSQRKPIFLEAELSWQNRINWPCTIEDFCPEGMFIKFDASDTDQIGHIYSSQADNAMNVAFTVGGRSFTILVKPVRIVHSAIGVMFLESYPDVFAAMLVEYSRKTGSARVIPENNKAAFVTRQFTKALRQHAQPLLDDFFESLEKRFKEAAYYSESDFVANALKDSVSLVFNRKRAITADFLEYLSSPAKTSSPEFQSKRSLTLIDKSEFEDWLTIKVMITRAEAEYRDTLLQLKMRLDQVGIVNATGYLNPYGPALFCHAFKAASSSLGLLKQAEKIYYKTFETEVLKRLEPLYVELNHILIRQNILPGLESGNCLTQQKNRNDQVAEPEENRESGPVRQEGESGGPCPTGQPSPHDAGNPIGALNSDAGFDAGYAALSDSRPGQERFPDVAEATVAGDSPGTYGQSAPEPGQGAVKPGIPSGFETGPNSAGAMPEASFHTRQHASAVPGRDRGELFEKALIPPFAMNFDNMEVQERFAVNRSNAESVFKSIQNLFSVLEKTRKGIAVNGDFVPVSDAPRWSLEELQNSLQRLQKLTARGQVSPNIKEERLTDRVVSDLQADGDREKVLDADQEETLDVVEQFFISMVSSEKVTEQVKAQLARLQVPVLKVLLKDKTFLERKDSPIRALLNRIAQLGLKGGRPSPMVQQRVDGVVNRINEEFEEDIAVFEEAVTELDELIERQNLLYRRNVERVMSAAEGSQKVELAKKVVSDEIDKRIAGRKIPKAVLSLINGGWRDLLSLTYIRQGENSRVWQNYLAVIDTLIAYGNNPEVDINLAELLTSIQDGLSSISSNHMPSVHIREELRQFIVGSKVRPPEMISVPEKVQDDEKEHLGQLPEGRYKRLQRWIHRAQKLEVGSWIKYIKNKDEPAFLRLVWVGKGFSKFVFVNHQGMKVIELELLKLAGMMQRGVLVHEPAYETPFVDQSLDDMIKNVYEQMSFVTTHDEITGLANRKAIERNIEKLLANGIANNSCSLLYIDLRQFRIINDTAGYDAGDKLLKEVAEIIMSYTPKGATLARMGGNEFAVLTDKPIAGPLGQKLLKAIREHEFQWAGANYEVSANIGIATSNEYLTNTEKLLRAAETACHSAKKLGANRLHIYDPVSNNFSRQEQIVAKVAGFKDLDEERILIRCQKIIPLRLHSKINTHYEILLSVYDDSGHLIPANEFVRTAELYGRMQTVDRWVVGYMMDWMYENRVAFGRMGGISINLSGHSLNDDSLLEFIYDKLSERKVPLEKVCFEITDTSTIANIADVADFMQELRETGCSFSLGKFGAGLSSYQLVKSLPVDLIKIDGSFIKSLPDSPGDQAIVRSMTEMAHFMGKEVIACQVEDKTSLDLLKAIGLDYAQGFLIEKPQLINTI